MWMTLLTFLQPFVETVLKTFLEDWRRSREAKRIDETAGKQIKNALEPIDELDRLGSGTA